MQISHWTLASNPRTPSDNNFLVHSTNSQNKKMTKFPVGVRMGRDYPSKLLAQV
jgi:hypothetical protein